MSSSTSTSDADDDDAASSPRAQKSSSSSSSSSSSASSKRRQDGRGENKDNKNNKCRFCRRRKPPPLSPSQRLATLPSSARENDALVLGGCDCRDAYLASAHKSCACRWFAPRARGVATGFALDPEWSLTWTCECEVCLAPLGASLLRDVVDVCKRALRSDPARGHHHHHHHHNNHHHRRRRFSAPSVTGDS